MATGIIRTAIQAQKTILIRPNATYWWEVMMTGAEKSHQFIDRRLAINYGKMWAAANPPSTVRVLDLSGSVDREWTYS